MPYCTADDIQRLYSEELIEILGDPTGSGVANADKIVAGCEAAQGIIDAYLTTKYSLPLTNPPQILKQLAIDIVVYRLALFPVQRTEEMRTRYEDAIKFLKELADGKAALPVAPVDADEDGNPDPVLVNFKTRILTLARG